MLLILGLNSCQPVRKVTRQEDAATRFAHVVPRLLNPQLTDENLERMFMPLDKVPESDFMADSDSELLIQQLESRQVDKPDPIKARKAYLRGRRLMDQRMYPQVIEQAMEGLVNDPNSPALYQLLAGAYLQTDDQTLAVQAAWQAIKRNSDALGAYQVLAKCSEQKGEHLQVVSILRRALQCPRATGGNPESAVIHLLLAQSLMELDYLAAATEQYQQVFDLLQRQRSYSHDDILIRTLTRQTHLPLITMASLYMQMGRIDKATAAITMAQGYFPAESDLMRAFMISLATQRTALQVRFEQVEALSRYLLAKNYPLESTLQDFFDACGKMSKHTDYLETLDHWSKPDDQNGGFVLLSGLDYAYGLSLAGKVEQAIAVLNELMPRQADQGSIHRDLSRLYALAEQWPQVVLHAGAFLQTQPDAALVIADWLTEIFAKRNIDEQIKELESWQSDPEISSSYGSCFLLGYLAGKLEKGKLAVHWYEKALEREPDFYQGRVQLVKQLLDSHRYNQAEKWIDYESAHAQNDITMLRLAGQAFAGLSNYPQAGNCFSRIIDLDKDDVEAYLSLADVLVAQGKFSPAEEILLRVQSHWPGRVEIYQHLLLLYVNWHGQLELDNPLSSQVKKRSWLMLGKIFSKTQSEVTLGQDRLEKLKQVRHSIIGDLDKLRAHLPDGLVVNMMLCKLYQDQSQLDSAGKQLDQLLQTHPQDESVLEMAGRFYEKVKDFPAAVDARRKLWQKHPDDPLLFQDVLQAMEQAHQHRQATALLVEMAQKPQWQNRETVQLLQVTALRLFMVTRQYCQAVTLFEQWHRLFVTQDSLSEIETTKPEVAETETIETETAVTETAETETVETETVETETTETKTAETENTEKSTAAQIAIENLIWALTQAQQYERAAQLVRNYYRNFEPEDSLVAIYLVHSMNVRLLFEPSYDLLTDLLKIMPDDYVLRLHLYLTMIERNQADQAVAEARSWAGEDLQDQRRQQIVSYLLNRIDAHDEALAFLDSYLARTPDDIKLQLEKVAVLRDARQFDLAEQMMAKIGFSSEIMPQWLDGRIKLDLAQDKLPLALSRLDDLDVKGGEDEVEKLKINVLAAGGQTAQAAERMAKLIEKNPDNLEIRLQLSIFLERIGKNEQAISELENVLADHPDNALVQNNLAYSLIQAHQEPNRARKLLEKSLIFDPESGPTLDSLGWLYYKEADFERALELIYQAAAGLVSPDAEIWDHLADVAYRLNRTDLARIYWEKALQEIKRQLPTERHLQGQQEKIETKIKQLTAGVEVDVAVLFSEVDLDGN